MSNDLFDSYAAAFGKVRQNAVNYMIGVTMRKAQSKVAKTFGMTNRQTAQTLGEARRKRTEAITQKIIENGLVSYRPSRRVRIKRKKALAVAKKTIGKLPAMFNAAIKAVKMKIPAKWIERHGEPFSSIRAITDGKQISFQIPDHTDKAYLQKTVKTMADETIYAMKKTYLRQQLKKELAKIKTQTIEIKAK